MKTQMPVNYREHKLHLFGQEFFVAGMAAPDERNDDPEAAMEYLAQRSNHNGILIGLKEENFSDLAERHHLSYYHLPIDDFKKASPEIYDKLYQCIKQARSEGKFVTIHCGAGNGRTGTAIASLKLRAIIEREAKKNPDILDEPAQNTTLVKPSMLVEELPCSLFVKEAIESTRTECQTIERRPTENGSRSVETANDIQALFEYENFVKLQLKAELSQKAREHFDLDILELKFGFALKKVDETLTQIKEVLEKTELESHSKLTPNIEACVLLKAKEYPKKHAFLEKIYEELKRLSFVSEDPESLNELAESLQNLAEDSSRIYSSLSTMRHTPPSKQQSSLRNQINEMLSRINTLISKIGSVLTQMIERCTYKDQLPKGM